MIPAEVFPRKAAGKTISDKTENRKAHGFISMRLSHIGNMPSPDFARAAEGRNKER
jgi:hypothetical protein